MKKRIASILTLTFFILFNCFFAIQVNAAGGGFWGKGRTKSWNEEENVKKYSAGQYKVGTDIPADEYIVFATSDAGYFCVSSDSNQDDIIYNDNFEYNSIITVYDGEYLDLSRCYAIPFSENPEVDADKTGMFKAGVHIPAGEYKLDSKGDYGYYCIYADSRQDDIIANDNFEGQAYVTVSDGQYLEIVRCGFVDVPEKPEMVYTDTETVQRVQSELNEIGYDCGTPDGIIGSNTADAIRTYQQENGIDINGKITEELLNSMGIVN